MNLRFIDWIWHVRGKVALAPGQSGDDAFDRLEILFRQRGTSHERNGDTLTFWKKDQDAQDKMSVFDGGIMRVEPAGSVLRYDLTSRALLFCFLAPLLFLSIAQLTVAIGNAQKPSTDAAGKSGKASGASQKPAAKKTPTAKKPDIPMNPLDKLLGAPAPDKPKKEGKDKEKGDGEDKPSPVPSYVFAAIFATLYLIGRVLEDRLVKSLFTKTLQGR